MLDTEDTLMTKTGTAPDLTEGTAEWDRDVKRRNSTSESPSRRESLQPDTAYRERFILLWWPRGRIKELCKSLESLRSRYYKEQM